MNDDPIATPPPRLDEFAPGTVIAVLDAPSSATAAVDAIRSLSEREPYLLTPAEILTWDQVRQGAAGPAQRLWRFLGSFVSDQSALQERYVDHARNGASVVVGAASDDRQAEAMWQELKRHGAHDGTHVAGMTLRELV